MPILAITPATSAIFSRCPYMPRPTETQITASRGTDSVPDRLAGAVTWSPAGLT